MGKGECLIRPWRLEDAPQLAATIDNPKIRDNLRDGLPSPYTVEDGVEFIQAMHAGRESGAIYAFAITVEDEVVGSISLQRGGNIHMRTAEIGYYLAEPFWGQGLMTQAVVQVCRFAFEHTDLLRIFAAPFDFNRASQRVLEKSGFQFEGILHKNAVKNGIIRDMHLYALTRDEKE